MSHVIALCGGVGGAKLAFDPSRVLSPAELSIVVNTGDDFQHLRLHVSPDIDRAAHTLSGLADPDRVRLAQETLAFAARLRSTVEES